VFQAHHPAFLKASYGLEDMHSKLSAHNWSECVSEEDWQGWIAYSTMKRWQNVDPYIFYPFLFIIILDKDI